MIYFNLRYLENGSSYRDKRRNILKKEFQGIDKINVAVREYFELLVNLTYSI